MCAPKTSALPTAPHLDKIKFKKEKIIEQIRLYIKVNQLSIGNT